MFQFDIDKDLEVSKKCDISYLNYEFTGNEDTIKIAQKKITSSSQNDILTGVMMLYGLMITQKKLCQNFIDNQTIKRLIALVDDFEIDFQIKNQILEFILMLCKAQKAFTHEFWYGELYEILIKIISDDSPSVLLSPPIRILSEMANWTKASYLKLVDEFQLSNILLHKLTMPLSIPDQYGVLEGLSSILASERANPENQNIPEIINNVCYHITNLHLNDQVLGKAFRVIGAALGAANEKCLEGIDLMPICEISVEQLQEQKRIEIRVEIIIFICNAIYAISELADIFLDLGILDIFHRLCKLAPEELMIKALVTVTNCLFSSAKTADYFINSKFLKDSVQFLQYGTQNVKSEALKMLSYIFDSNSKFFNTSFASDVLEKFDILDSLSDFLQLDESSTDSMFLISWCLTIINTAIDIYSKAGGEMPSPPIKLMLDEFNYERLLSLTTFVDEKIRTLAISINNEVSKYAE